MGDKKKTLFTVTGDVTFPFVMSVEADSEEEAELLVAGMSSKDIPYSTDMAGVLVDVQDVYKEG